MTDKSQLYACLEIKRFRAGRGTEVAYSTVTQAARLLPSHAVDLLLRCQGFDNLENHASQIAKARGSDLNQQTAIKSQLQDLVRSGLLISEAHVLSCLKRESETIPPHSQITTIAIPTRDRPDTLRRAVLSYLRDFAEQCRTPRFLIVDDSESESASERVREVIASLSKESGVDFQYSGLRDRIRLTEVLADRTGFRSDDIRFGLLNVARLPFALGACWNFILLSTVGELCVIVDDDSVCNLKRPPDYIDGLALSSDWDPTESWFDQDENLDSRVFPVVGDFLGCHEELLGRDLSSCVTRCLAEQTPLNLNGLQGNVLKRLSDPMYRILVTNGSVYGDCGMSCTHELFLTRGPSRNRLTKNEQTYRQALSGRRVFRSPRGKTICKDSYIVGCNMGLDNRSLLPPFFPHLRGPETSFARCLKSCFGAWRIGFVPYALHHNPPQARSHSMDDIWAQLSGNDAEDILPMLFSSWSPAFDFEQSEERERLLGLSDHLLALGSMPVADFRHSVRSWMYHVVSRRLSRADEALKEANGQPQFWSSDLGKYTATLSSAAVSADYEVPRDLLNNCSSGRAVSSLQQSVKDYAALLRIWPDIVDTVKELRFRGMQLATSVQ